MIVWAYWKDTERSNLDVCLDPCTVQEVADHFANPEYPSIILTIEDNKVRRNNLGRDYVDGVKRAVDFCTRFNHFVAKTVNISATDFTRQFLEFAEAETPNLKDLR